MPTRTTRRTLSTQQHRQDMLAMLEAREIDRRSELERFPSEVIPPEDDEAASPCPIMGSWFAEGGADAVRRLKNFTPREINLLWSSVRPHMTRYWNVGRGRRSQFTGKDVLLMTLTVFKHGGTWDMNAHIFHIKTPTFIKTVTSFWRVLAPRIYDDWVRTKADETKMRHLVTSGNTFRHFPCALYATDVTFPAGRLAGLLGT